MKKVCLVLLFIYLSQLLFSQNQHKADSLKQLYSSQENQLSDSIKFELLRDIVSFEGSRDQALYYGQILLDVAKASNDQIKIAEALEELSLIHRTLGNVIRSTEVAFQAQTIYRKLGLRNREAASITQLASNLLLESQYSEAIKNYREALSIYNEISDTIRISLTSLNLGEAFRLRKEMDSAQAYLNQALFLNSFCKSKTYENKIVHGYATGNLGLVFQKSGQYEQAQPLLKEAIALLKELGDLYSVSVYSFELGNIFINVKKGKEGEKMMLQAYQTALNEGFKEQIRDFSRSLATYYQSNGDFKEALHFQQQYQYYKDSLINIDNVRKVEQLKAQYEVNQREAEITLLNRISHGQRQMVIGLSVGATLLLVLLGLLYRNNQQKKKTNIALAQREKEKALLLKELNHRTKNNLQMISSLLNLQSTTMEGHPAAVAVREGRYRVDSLVLIHQKLYKEDYSHLDMKQYLQELIDHLSISFNPVINIEADIMAYKMSVDQAIPLALIVNELLTNAMKYGNNPNTSIQKVWVSLQNNKGLFQLNIRDNGPGMKEPDINALSSFGLLLVHSLVEQLEGSIAFDGTEGVCWNISFTYD